MSMTRIVTLRSIGLVDAIILGNLFGVRFVLVLVVTVKACVLVVQGGVWRWRPQQINKGLHGATPE